jgi:hypothetical protein
MRMRTGLLVTLALVVSLATSVFSPVVGMPASPPRTAGDAGGTPIGVPPGPHSTLEELPPGAQPLAVGSFPMEDTRIDESYPTMNYGWEGGFRVRSSAGAASALMRWDLTSIPTGAAVQNARLELYATYRSRAWQVDIAAYEVLAPWQESSATWNLAASGVPWAEAGCRGIGTDRSGSASATTTILPGDPIPGWYRWTLTTLVQKWVDEPAANRGLILVASGSTVSYDFMSSEGNPTFQPKLIVDYLPPQATATPTRATPTTTPTPSRTLTNTLGPSPTRTASPTATSARGTIQGVVFNDRNENGLRDTGEAGLSGATVVLQTAGGATVGTRYTAADGLYAFTGLSAATFRLIETNPPEYTSTTADEWRVPVSVGDVWTIDFGDRLTGSVTPTYTPAGTPLPTYTPSLTPATPVATATRTQTLPPSATPSITPTPSRTPTYGPSPTPTRTPTSWIDTSRAIRAHCLGVFTGDTTGKPNNAHHYGTLDWDESGPEDVYILVKTVTSDLTISLEYSTGDLDVFLLYEPYPPALLKGGDSEITQRELAPGTYYIVVDGFQGSMGPYRLTVNCEGEPMPTSTATLRPTATNTPVHGYWPLLYKMPTPTPTLTRTPTATPTPPPYQQAVNCGGQAYQASDGYVYAADQEYRPGSWGWAGGRQDFVTRTDHTISNTDDDPLYQAQRYGMNAYRFTVPPGRYEVFLGFAEILPYTKRNQRVFSVFLEGNRIIDHLDMMVGPRYMAWPGKYCVQVGDGVLDITFEQHMPEYAPVINAIRIVSTQRCP